MFMELPFRTHCVRRLSGSLIGMWFGRSEKENDFVVNEPIPVDYTT